MSGHLLLPTLAGRVSLNRRSDRRENGFSTSLGLKGASVCLPLVVDLDDHLDTIDSEQTMELNDLHPPDDYSHRFFIWHEWIQANGPLTNENVFDYFATSMFYDKQSNNQVLRMQTMHTGEPLLNEAEELRRFTGIEFAVVHSQPPSLFIIHKRERLSADEEPTEDRTQLTSLHSLQTSLDTLRSHRPAYTPRTGFIWPIKEAPASEDSKKRSLEEVTDETQPPQPPEGLVDSSQKRKLTVTLGHKKRQNNVLLVNAMRTTAVHSTKSFSIPTALSESVVADTPASATAGRSSATPAPITQRGATPKLPPGSTAPQETASAKGPLIGGKKKKKREYL
ncbi:hypothetical protein PHLCEN_2v6651 [Hermanssonia centrifuga]|uniref:Mediator of RNA polymerase II transcription subunit 6 n=1 Tax=Hermanssonia centrifuga TaxID=98765 RepID=A0A2R6NYU7_9APHY|nr:hypothetical protein PHLCEN_2v6651 [Hermanssonia centrifuga]